MHADLVFTRGPVLTPGGRAGFAAVRGDRIVAVGDDPGPLIGPRTDVVDLRGRLLVPGFQDAHVHAVGGGVELGRCDLTGAGTVVSCLDTVAAYARANPRLEWLTGSGWSLDTFAGGLPHRRLLDAVVPERPVVLVNRDHHGAWLNSAALARAGITEDSPDPPDGRIERDADGVTGVLQEGAMNLVTRLLPPVTETDELAGLLRAQRLLHSLGVTAWQDPLLGDYGGMPDPSRAYATASGRGLLTARVTGALWWDRTRGADQLPDLLARRDSLRDSGFRAGTVKIMLDGIAENHTAALLGPYRRTGHSGLGFVDPVALREHVTLLDAHGFQVHFHAVGDRAVRDALDAVEAARAANGVTGNRHHLAHVQVVHPDDVPRFGRLDATATIQPLWAVHEPDMDELTIPFLGDERTSWQYPFGALLRSGATLAAGSDWPVSSPDPLQGIHAAVNRIPYGEDLPAFLPGQRIDLAAAIAAYTAGSAYVNHLDDTGAIRPGHRADLVVLDRDPFAGPDREIGATKVAMTFTGGRCVHEP
ncbi:amidohydrolase [Amycolatopsis sp. RTGN1]|uniref:amidohydrolase n=1 Tax=Amycolatopsis ponsaeliensis TaxID=2992142 RepID=UPI00254B93ED|nr:amidohydrolase [Amycolatopsis sp. RTGN1]